VIVGGRVPPPWPVYLPAPAAMCDPNRDGVAWWLALHGLTGGGTLFDVLGMHHGALTSGAGWQSPLHPGGWGAITYDGVGSYVDCGDLPDFAFDVGMPFSLSAWITMTSTASNSAICNKYGPAGFGPGYFLSVSSGNPFFQLAAANGAYRYRIGLTTVTSGRPYHVAGTYDGSGAVGGIRLYQDGIECGSYSDGESGTMDSLLSTNHFQIGRRGDGLFFPGAIDDVRVHARALAPAEIRNVYLRSRLGYPGVLRRYRPARAGTAVAGFRPYYRRPAVVLGSGVH
jgi:hypothetical protein